MMLAPQLPKMLLKNPIFYGSFEAPFRCEHTKGLPHHPHQCQPTWHHRTQIPQRRNHLRCDSGGWVFLVLLSFPYTPGNSTIQSRTILKKKLHVPYVKEIPDIPISLRTKKTGSSSQHSTGGMKTCFKWPLYMPVIISKKICMNVASLSNRHLAMWQSNWMSPNNRAFRCHRFLWTVPAAFHPRSPHSSGHRPVLGNKALPKKKSEPPH